MPHICPPELTPADIYVIENTDREILKQSIAFLQTYHEVMWLDNDTGTLFPSSQKNGHRFYYQPQPQYPPQLRQMGEMFFHMMWYSKEFRISVHGLHDLGFFTENTLADQFLPSMFSASLIASIICDAFVRERYVDGLFGHGAEDGTYLKMLLRLNDLIQYYDFLQHSQAQKGDTNA